MGPRIPKNNLKSQVLEGMRQQQNTQGKSIPESLPGEGTISKVNINGKVKADTMSPNPHGSDGMRSAFQAG